MLTGAQVVVDVSNSPSFAADDVLAFFRTSTTNLLAAAARAGVGHYVALSIVGVDRMSSSGYMRAKIAQEALITAGPVPYSIVRATQFFEFLGGIAASSTVDGAAHLTPALLQPVAADDVAASLADVAQAPPTGGVTELAGPSAAPLATFVERFLRATGSDLPVVADPKVGYFGADVDDTSLVAGPDAHIGAIAFESWLASR